MSKSETTDWSAKLREAVAQEQAAGFYYYNKETRDRLGADFARTYIDLIMRAINRAGLQLTKK